MPDDPRVQPQAVSARAAANEPDAHGQAAMLLIESLIHALVARSTLTVGEAIEIVDVAADVKRELAHDLGDSPSTLKRSLAILGAISQTLEHDYDGA